MQIEQLASLLLGAIIEGDPSVDVTGVQTDSREVQAGDLFICLPGYTQDGHEYAAQAVERGAKALVVERRLPVSVPQLIVKDSRYAMAVLANHFYDYPSHEMKVIGITGTNGKTTTAAMLEKIIADQGFVTGLMGTVRMKIGDRSYDTKNTTQEALELQRNFRSMRDVGTEYCVMEVSSHALAIGRVKGVNFRTAVFTNLTQDHLDFHQSMQRYKEAKSLLFARMGNTFSALPELHKYAVLNADDDASIDYSAMTSAQVVTYGIDRPADVMAHEIRLSARGTEFTLDSFAGTAKINMKLIGKFSVYNALAAMTAALCEGIPLPAIQRSIEAIQGVDGRFEPVNEGQQFIVIVDYAHTPDSLENVLSTISEFAEGNIICVFGCGGDRDRTKRPLMGSIAARYSDYVIVTSDNPRSEDPESILQDIEAGMKQENMDSGSYELIVDRRQAIEKAVEMASPKDVVLIAGKGHETYQETNGIRNDFDDRLVAQNAIRRRMM